MLRFGTRLSLKAGRPAELTQNNMSSDLGVLDAFASTFPSLYASPPAVAEEPETTGEGDDDPQSAAMAENGAEQPQEIGDGSQSQKDAHEPDPYQQRIQQITSKVGLVVRHGHAWGP